MGKKKEKFGRKILCIKEKLVTIFYAIFYSLVHRRNVIFKVKESISGKYNFIVSQVKMEFFMLLIVGILLLGPETPML